MGRGKHSADKDEYYFQSKFREETDYEDDDESNLKYKIIAIVVIIIAVIIIALIVTGKIPEFGESTNNTVNTAVQNTNTENQTKETKLIDTHEGYKVLGKIVIKDLNVEQYILDSTEDTALEKGIIKLYGGTLNNYGNLCLAGHDYDEVFGKLDELEVGDTFTLIEPNLKETTYEVKKIYSTEANDLECLLPDEEKVEITLITCENGSTTRLIVKAEEKNV